MEDSHPELESFRQQWRAEVSARSKIDESKGQSKAAGGQVLKRRQAGPSKLTTGIPAIEHNEDEGLSGVPRARRASDGPVIDPSIQQEDVRDFGSDTSSQEPRSALEHYEKAVERESQGSLGDSLNLYRKAFKMDSQVDQKYKSKHFPPSYFASKPSHPSPSKASPTVPNMAHHSLDGPSQTLKDLLAGFQGMTIEPSPPEIEGMPPRSCPISKLPHEILVHILRDVAILDVASFVRLAQACKRFAYMVGTEEQIWKRICLGSEVGFGAMHYKWQREISGEPSDNDLERIIKGTLIEGETTEPVIDSQTLSESLLHAVYSSSWQEMFCLRPRVRFNGVYISTVNYPRPGQASASQITWNSPVHIVTYYRYLRFFRDGTVISLQTTSEPTDVVHFLTKSFHESHKISQGSHLPSAFMQSAFKGRWRLSTVADSPNAELRDCEGDVFVETEGIGRYVYHMELSLRSVGKGAKNNKLAWKKYWHYNTLSDDSAEFALRNEKNKAFFWSRVKSYGTGA